MTRVTFAPVESSRLTEQDLGLRVALEGHGLQHTCRVDEVAQHDVGASKRDHLAETAVVDSVDGVQAEAGGENAVESCRRPASLDVSEHGGAGFLAGALLDLIR